MSSNVRAALVPPITAGQVRELLHNTELGPILFRLDDDSSFGNAGMDSLALLEVVGELQNAAGLEIPDDDVERLSTITGIVQYLNERMR